jgi:hypothetical protein
MRVSCSVPGRGDISSSSGLLIGEDGYGIEHEHEHEDEDEEWGRQVFQTRS